MTETQNQAEPDPGTSETPAEGAWTNHSAEPAPEVGGENSAETAETVETVDPAGEVERWKDLAARAQADLENYRKRMARERQEAVQYANRGLLEQLLPVIDNFEMGLKAAENVEGGAVILQGLAMVRKQLADFLADQGVEEVPSEGVAFDPNLHEAVKQEPHETAPEGSVLLTLRRGYRLRDRLLRAATVVVSAGPPSAEQGS
jgi:molecular chaperone GrpE